MSYILNKQLYKGLKDDYNNILKTYKLLEKTFLMQLPVHPAGQWILDNMYIIEHQYHEILEQKRVIFKSKLPVIKTRNGQKNLSIFHIAHELIENNKGYVDQNYIRDTLIQHQKSAALTSEELDIFPLMLKISIIKFISVICLNVANSQFQKIEVEKIFEDKGESERNIKIAKKFEKDLVRFKKDKLVAEKLKSTNTAYVEYLAFKLKELGSSGDEFYKILNDCAKKIGFTVEEAIVKEHMEITKTTDYMSRAITGLKHMSSLNYREIFESVNKIDETLMNDYTGEFKICDYKTKTRYRNRVIKLAKKYGLSEVYVASKALDCSIKYKKHVGFFLSGEQKYLLNKELGKSYVSEWLFNNVLKKIRPQIYVLSMALLAAVINYFICKLLFSNLLLSQTLKIIVGILMFAPSFEVSQKFIDYVIRKVSNPKILPRFDFAKTIDEKYSTYIIMPSVINSFNKIDDMIRKLEVTYLANRSENMYYMLLGDCVPSNKKVIDQDSKYVKYAKEKLDKLNEKYPSKHILFNFIYRKRVYSKGEGAYMGWERKRGAIKDFNELVLGKLTKDEIDEKMYLAYNDIVKTKYAITIDEDTQLSLNTAKDLVAIIAHPLNAPRLSKDGRIVKSGHALIQPGIGLDVESANKTIFSKTFGGFGGIDVYTLAISNVYQDLFNEAIFCGKGIYDIELFEKLLSDEIPENLVLSHDLLEGSYLRAGLASDIQVEDGFPNNYVAYMKRNHRWYRGDMQIIKWLISPKSPLNFLSKWKIFDNIRRPLLDVFIIAILIMSLVISPVMFITALLILFVCYGFGHLLGIVDSLIFGKAIHTKELLYIPIIHGTSATLMVMTFDFLTLPYRAYICLDAFLRSLYRMLISKKHMLEWTTAEVLEKTAKTKLSFYYSNMLPNVTMGALVLLFSLGVDVYVYKLFETFIALSYILTPVFAYLLGKSYLFTKKKKLDTNARKEVLEIAERTWKFFDFTMTKVNNYLPTDNYQETRRYKIVNRTSSTNVGFGILAIINAYDLHFITKSNCITRLNDIMCTVDKLEKWYGHLYNWYNIKTLEPLRPRFISTVDSGNFLATIYVLKEFILELIEKTEDNEELAILNKIYKQSIELIKNTDFTKLYDASRNLFSIGFAQEEGKLLDSYYDMLMSENRTTSLIAIASKQITSKHWFALGRKLAKLDGYKGLVSWSGTAFEYFMPYLFIKSYPHTLSDQSLFFTKYSQKLFAKKNNIPWGVSESAFAVKDSQLNYQYKAFGIPWLGLKRGLGDELVISPYASLLMMEYAPVDVYKNVQTLKSMGTYSTFGFYESIDYTKEHLGKNEEYEIVKTYMAHHQGMILTAINNYLNSGIIKRRFHKNPNIAAVEILLKERERMVASIKKDPSKKYKDRYKEQESKYTTSISYNEYNKEISNLENIDLAIASLTGNNSSLILTADGGQYFRYKNKTVNRQRLKNTKSSYNYIYITDTRYGNTFIANNAYDIENDEAKVQKSSFYTSLDSVQYYVQTSEIECTTTVFLMPEYNVEVQKIMLYNNSKEDREIIINTYMEPSLTDYMTDVVHPSFNNLQIETYYDSQLEALIASKRKKNDNDTDLFVFTKLIDIPFEQEIETEKSKLSSITDENAYDGNIGKYPLWPVMSHRTKIILTSFERQELYYVTGVFESKYKMTNAIVNLNRDMIKEQKRISEDINIVNCKYLKLEEGKAAVYNKVICSLIFENRKKDEKFWGQHFDQSMLWKYSISGDLPILVIKVNSIDSVGIIKDITQFMEYVKNRKIDIDIVVIILGNKYSDKMYDYMRKVLDRVTYLDYTRGNIYLLNEQNLSVDDRKLFDFVAKRIVTDVDTFLS